MDMGRGQSKRVLVEYNWKTSSVRKTCRSLGNKCAPTKELLDAMPFGDIRALDSGLRRRMRLYHWKQWGRPRTRRRKLLKPGIAREEVHRASRARKGHWRMSQNELVRWAMNNQWLEEQGLPNLAKQWCSIRYPAGPKGAKEQQVANWNRRATDPYGRWNHGHSPLTRLPLLDSPYCYRISFHIPILTGLYQPSGVCGTPCGLRDFVLSGPAVWLRIQ
jgi:hypothetical protein